ncbi:Hypothetical predicted protein, partial [Paramuricea clavata]
ILDMVSNVTFYPEAHPPPALVTQASLNRYSIHNTGTLNICIPDEMSDYPILQRNSFCQDSMSDQKLFDSTPVFVKVFASKERLIATIQHQHVRCKDVESQLVNMHREIRSNSIEINKTLEDDILSILDKSDLKTLPHMNLFWQQQKKLLVSPKFGRRYHPHLIRFCLSLHSKSPSAYRELVSSGVLVLLSERILRDYRNFFKPKPGFNEANVTQLREQTNQLFDVQRYVVLSFVK